MGGLDLAEAVVERLASRTNITLARCAALRTGYEWQESRDHERTHSTPISLRFCVGRKGWMEQVYGMGSGRGYVFLSLPHVVLSRPMSSPPFQTGRIPFPFTLED